MSIKAGDTVECIDTVSGSKIKLGTQYVVREVRYDGFLRFEGMVGSFRPSRFLEVEPKTAGKAKPAAFGQIKSVTVNMSDIHDVLTQYVRFGLGINATVEKLVDKFPEAVELVLKHEVAA
ncbi:hypothetical protein C7I87_00565 [Mesorhizobium sp. SARCC-RB16n]|uniref:hypothetical protein n=1 Tax=Mesorhizobium sp. SARCC-RB16n TaxID=2116687 RepID=UPI00122EB771|nr:hypothetical protein [Mesorhizobium sp. SARCC-RB16n]KAA3452705.1 hypothetical protein C7I87_00565 [Mesorhizobium sp. SARCC-RB16n]